MALSGGENVEVRESSIHGLGVFALRPFRAGELILVRDESRVVDSAHPLDEEGGEYEWHCEWLAGDRQVLLPSPERHINHSCEPNSFVRWLDGLPNQGHNIALRDIAAGEEITHSYSVNLADGVAWACGCGTARCLGVVLGEFFELPRDRALELAPLLASWFIDEHRAEYDALVRGTANARSSRLGAVRFGCVSAAGRAVRRRAPSRG